MRELFEPTNGMILDCFEFLEAIDGALPKEMCYCSLEDGRGLNVAYNERFVFEEDWLSSIDETRRSNGTNQAFFLSFIYYSSLTCHLYNTKGPMYTCGFSWHYDLPVMLMNDKISDRLKAALPWIGDSPNAVPSIMRV